jgi:hypothetical protein
MPIFGRIRIRAEALRHALREIDGTPEGGVPPDHGTPRVAENGDVGTSREFTHILDEIQAFAGSSERRWNHAPLQSRHALDHEGLDWNTSIGQCGPIG